MFDARTIPPATADYQEPEAQPIRVEDYDAKAHRGRTLCGDFRCAARLYYRSEGRAFGDLTPRVPHFATMPGDVHREDCTHHNPDTEQRLASNVRQALLEGKNILLNLNLDTGLSLGDDFSRAADPLQENTIYGRFLRRANHFAVSVKSVNDVMRIRNALLRSGHEDALDRTYVGHRHEIRKFDNFFIGADKGKLKTLFNSLAAGTGVMLQGPQQLVTGFPRVVCFEPTAKTRSEGLRTGRINGTSQYLADEGKVLLQNLGLKDKTIRRDILENIAIYILAAPTIDRAAQDPKYKIINWQIAGESQYAADPERIPAQPKLL
ncbi:MAG: hypothetical protein KKA05_02480 [Alphaproteobacteria bacterium]|nr:hypothetical protein [Alphaproteobacteria bacterium]MBU0860178.1 hypothetical protein [Alphaproteobacteria bacterium]